MSADFRSGDQGHQEASRLIGPLQLGKMLGALYGAMGLRFIPFLGIFALVGAFSPKMAENTSSSPNPAIFAGFGLVLVICVPILYALMGFVFGLVGAVIYNLFAKWLGGIEVEVE